MSTVVTSTGPIEARDVMPIRSRVSWSAVLAGAVIAITITLFLTVFSGTLGLTLNDQGVRSGTAALVSVIAAIFAGMVGLFVGGWTTSRLIVGEDKCEAGIHGLLMWATVFVITAGLIGTGVKSGYNALLAGAIVGQNADTWEEAAVRAGVSQERINQIKAQNNPETVKAQVQSPENQEKAREAGIAIGWSSLAAMVFTLLTSMAGALFGAGPEFKISHLIRPSGTTARREVLVTASK